MAMKLALVALLQTIFDTGTPKRFILSIMPSFLELISKTVPSAAVEEAIKDGIKSKWNGRKPSKLWDPLQDGDDKADTNPEYADCWFVTAKSNSRPGVVDAEKVEIMDPEEIYSGCYGRASITFYPYNKSSNGIGAALNNVQKLSEGERLGGSRASAEDDFADDFEDDYEDDF